MVNPKLIELYGEKSREPLNNLINSIGIAVATKTYVNTRIPYNIVNGAKMPSSLFTEPQYSNYVRDCVKVTYDSWGGEASGKAAVVWSENPNRFSISLCESEKSGCESSEVLNAAAEMSRE